MNKPLAIILIAIGLLVTILRISRCAGKIDSMQRNNAKENYIAECQEKVDSAWHYFKPVAQKMEANTLLPDAELMNVTDHLTRISNSAAAIKGFQSSDSYRDYNYKLFVKEYIDHIKGLTCCYLKRYQDELAKDKKIQKSTAHNLLSWMEKYEQYSGAYGEAVFNLHNHSDFTGLHSAVMLAPVK